MQENLKYIKYSVPELEGEIPDNMQWELHDGQVYLMGSPKADHQDIVGELYGQLREYFKGKRCHPYIAPFDLYLFNDPGDSVKELFTKFQPDIFVACEQRRVVRGDYSGYYGVPALIVEVLSKSTQYNDKIYKKEKYRQAGVPEYWLVDPVSQKVEIHLFKNEVEEEVLLKVKGDVVNLSEFPECSIDLEAVFDAYKDW